MDMDPSQYNQWDVGNENRVPTACVGMLYTLMVTSSGLASPGNWLTAIKPTGPYKPQERQRANSTAADKIWLGWMTC